MSSFDICRYLVKQNRNMFKMELSEMIMHSSPVPVIYIRNDTLIYFNGKSTHRGLFDAKRLDNLIHRTGIFTFLCCFLRGIFAHGPLK